MVEENPVVADDFATVEKNTGSKKSRRLLYMDYL